MTATTEELQLRLQRLYAAVGAVIDMEATATFQPRIELSPDGFLKTAEWNFGAAVPSAESQNIAWTAIHNTAMFYDHCLHWAQKTGVATDDDVKAVTASCLALRIVRDLYNSDKHPQGRPNTSGLSPELRDVRRVARMVLSQATQGKTTIIGGMVFQGGAANLTTVGDIVNGRSGKVVAHFPDVIEEGVRAWETFLASKNVLA